MGLIFFFIIIVIVFILLAVNYKNNKALENKKEDYLNQDVHVLGHKLKVRDFQNIDSKRLKEKIEALKVKNKHIADVQNYYFSIVNKARKLESNKKYEEAILEYNKGLNYAYSEPILKIHNYAHSIHMLIILYGKIKNYQRLEEHLKESIYKHPDWKDSKDWEKRLNKLN